MIDVLLILQGEILSWSLMGVKGLRVLLNHLQILLFLFMVITVFREHEMGIYSS